MNRGEAKKTRQPSLITKASFVSKWTFWWLKPMFKIGMRRPIEEDDICNVLNSMRSDENTTEFNKLWQQEIKKPDPSIMRVMIKIRVLKVLVLGLLFSIGETLAKLVQPICLGGFVGYFAQTKINPTTLNDAYWYASGIVFSTVFMIATYHPFALYVYKTSYKIRVALSGLIYQKSLRILKSSAEEGQNGKIINLMSNDLTKIDIGLGFFHDFWKGPLEALTFFGIIYMEIGVSAVVGMAFLLSFIPLQAWIGQKSAKLRMKNAKRTDFRVKIMNEIIQGIQVIKMYAWEKSFAKMIDQIRKKEVNAIRSIAYNRATINSFTMISKMSIFLSLISYVYLGNIITAQKVFIISSYFNSLNQSMIYFWPVTLMNTCEAYVSLKRVQEFLLRPECKYLNKTTGKDQASESKEYENETVAIEELQEPVQNIDSSQKCIRFQNVTAMWVQNEEHQTNGIFNMNLEINLGLCAVIGQVGSSKSTLLNVILGELSLDMGSITKNGSISYASQEPWIFEGSIRNNIIFVEEFDEQRYKKVVEVCALERDFKLLPEGDATIVGEQGSSLSGGQKARVNLARAIYKQSDIYLLDDPLSAVDMHVGKHIFEKCIKEFLADKICVLVTHQLQYLRNVNHVVLLNNGKIEAEGPFQTLQKFHKESLMNAQEEGDQAAVDATRLRKHSSSISFCDENIDGSISRKEFQLTGSVKFSTYKTYFKAAHSRIFNMIVFILFIAAQIAWSGSDFLLSKWVNWEESVVNTDETSPSIVVPNNTVQLLNNNSMNQTESEQDAVESKRQTFLMIYTCIMVFGTVFYVGRSFSFFRMCLRISINLHDMIFRSVTRAKMCFFNNNPSGRILNRFAGDINVIDSLLPNNMVGVLDYLLQYLAIMVINVIVNPWLLIPATIMMFLFYVMRTIYINTGRSFKRIEATSRSSILSHINATLQGSSTIRAFNGNKMLEKEFHEFQDNNTSCWYLFLCASRWLALWLDIVCLLFVAFVTYSFLIIGNEMQSGMVGIAIMNSINLIRTCQWGIRQSAELESQMTSVERIIEYTELTSEPSLESDAKNAPSADWPQSGNIEFKSLNLRYIENGSRILRNLSFRIDAKEKIGVVGRTGAGKSSIIQALFRMAQNQGQIIIDGIDIGTIGLHDLRKKISIIPQEAVLFSGSLRSNLDPFGEKGDADLWDALEQVELKTVVSSLPGGIDCRVLDGGSNFSSGQRQLLCLARAILRNNKILILDEATASVDSETDKLIQQTIRNKFDECTVVMIAHRLNTVMDSDKVLFIDAGEIMEFGHPFELIQKPNGYFKRLLDQTGLSTATMLTLTAKENYERNEAKDK